MDYMDLSLDQISSKQSASGQGGGGGRGGGGKAQRIRGRGSRGSDKGEPYTKAAQRKNVWTPDEKGEFGVVVRNLPFSVSWQSLKDMFKPFGSVVFADIATEKGKRDGRSLGWGRVKFSSGEARERAISELDQSAFEGRILDVREDMPREERPPRQNNYQRQLIERPEFRNDSNDGNEYGVYVGQLPWTVTWKDLKDIFRSCGEVTYADVATEGGPRAGPDARSLGFGIVRFSSVNARDRAISKMNGTTIRGRTIVVRRDEKERDQRARGFGAQGRVPRSQAHSDGVRREVDASTGFSVYVGNLPWEVDRDQLLRVFKAFGPVVDADVATRHGHENGRSLGWGTVVFQYAEDKDNAIRSLDRTEWDGRLIEVRDDRKGQEYNVRTNNSFRGGNAGGRNNRGGNGTVEYAVSVTNLPDSFGWRQLKDLFAQDFQDVSFADVQTANGMSTGCGVVKFGSQRSQQRAVQIMNGFVVEGRPINVMRD